MLGMGKYAEQEHLFMSDHSSPEPFFVALQCTGWHCTLVLNHVKNTQTLAKLLLCIFEAGILVHY